jgi:hypothetical protein
VRRTQLYLDENLWEALHTQARIRKTTISDLVREAIREKYKLDPEARRRALMGIVVIWKDRDDIGDPDEYVRKLRRGTRMKRLGLS